MSPIHGHSPPGTVLIYRLDREQFAPTWDSGLGAFNVGGRWNRRGRHAVYGSLDGSTAVLEVVAHIGVRALERERYVMTVAQIEDPSLLKVVHHEDFPNPRWGVAGEQSDGQYDYGGYLLNQNVFTAVASAVNPMSWNVIFDTTRSCFRDETRYTVIDQFRYGSDPRLSR